MMTPRTMREAGQIAVNSSYLTAKTHIKGHPKSCSWDREDEFYSKCIVAFLACVVLMAVGYFMEVL